MIVTINLPDVRGEYGLILQTMKTFTTKEFLINGVSLSTDGDNFILLCLFCNFHLRFEGIVKRRIK
jgi:hypothetical protein